MAGIQKNYLNCPPVFGLYKPYFSLNCRVHHTLFPDETLLLRTWSRRDTVLLHGLVLSNADFLRKWLPWVDELNNLKAVEEYINQTQMSLLGQQNHFYGIWEHGELVGEIAHHGKTKRNKCTSVSYWLGEKYQGRGIVTRSLQTLLTDLFIKKGVNRVEIRIAPGNSKSQLLAEKFGFSKEGTLREAEWLYDHFVDHELLSLLRSDWEKGQ